MTAAVIPLQRHRHGHLLESFHVGTRAPVQVRTHPAGVEVDHHGIDRWRLDAPAVPAYVQAVLTAVAQHPDSDPALVADLLDVLTLHGVGDPDDPA